MNGKAIAQTLDGPVGWLVVIGGVYILVNMLIGKLPPNPLSNLQGPAPGQSWGNYLFGSGGTLDAQGNFVE